jgi:hypothetical protein
LPLADFSVNNAWQESIKNTPFMLNFGQQLHTALIQSGDREVRVSQVNNFARTLEENLARVKASLLAARSRQQLFSDERGREVELAVGQKVLLSTINFKLVHPGTRKLLLKWVGPFEAQSNSGRSTYHSTHSF